MTSGKTQAHRGRETNSIAGRSEKAAKTWGERLARAGYVAKGIIYVIIGVLVLQAGTHYANPNVDKNVAIASIVAQPQGQLFLAVLALALLGYAGWRLAQGILDVEHEGKKEKGLAQRAGYVLSGLSYASLALTAIQILIGYSTARKNSIQDITAVMMRQPFGRFLVGLAGLLVAVLGVYMIYRAVQGDIERRFQSGKLSAEQRRWLIRAGRFGYAARAVVYIPIGLFLVQAAVQYNPQKATGFGQAIQALGALPYGPYILVLVALGLVAYGVYSVMLGMYRRISF